MRQPFDWDLIRAFLAVARNGKLTGGAKHLRIDHSTLSRRLATLEESLGTKLFDHNVSGYSLTAQGEQLLVRAEGIESSIFALDHQFGQSTRISGAVRIGAPDGFAAAFLAPAIGKLTASHPDLEIEIVAIPRLFSLSKREADIAVALSCPPRGRLHGRKLTDFEFGVYAAKAQPELWQNIEKPEDFAGMQFIGYIEEMIFTPELDYIREVSKSIIPRLRSSNMTAQWQAAAAGVGLCVLPCFIGDSDSRLVRVLPKQIAFTRTYWMIVHSDMRDIARIKVTCDFIAEEVRRARGRFMPSPSASSRG
jgi:DNA-binding transcriptional LysR family regulator